MAKRVEDQCVGCPQGMGCLGSSCPYKNVLVFECDECGSECEELFAVPHLQGLPLAGKEVCEECLKGMFPKITYDSFAEERENEELAAKEAWYERYLEGR